MKRAKAELGQAFRLEEYPRSAKYDIAWVIENMMGPNVLWLTEALRQVMDLKVGMRVLDMGCGKCDQFHLSREGVRCPSLGGRRVDQADLELGANSRCRCGGPGLSDSRRGPFYAFR